MLKKVIMTMIITGIVICCSGFSSEIISKAEEIVVYGLEGEPKTILLSEKEEYLNTELWFETQQEAIDNTVQVYAADGRTMKIMKSEVELYITYSWSPNQPITIYSLIDGSPRVIIPEEKEGYMAHGIYCNTYEEYEKAPLPVFSYNPFTKSNLSVKQLNEILSGLGTLEGQGQAFYDMENKYGVNAMFAVGVACHESGNGKSSAARKKNNPFGIGPGKTFKSTAASIDYFGSLIVKYNRSTIESIGKKYCQDGTNWSGMVKNHMQQKWAKFN